MQKSIPPGYPSWRENYIKGVPAHDKLNGKIMILEYCASCAAGYIKSWSASPKKPNHNIQSVNMEIINEQINNFTSDIVKLNNSLNKTGRANSRLIEENNKLKINNANLKSDYDTAIGDYTKLREDYDRLKDKLQKIGNIIINID